VRELAVALPRALAAFPARIGARSFRLTIDPRTRLRLLAAAAAVVALGSLYQFWFRESSFVAVDHVEVTGLSTKDAPRIRSALAAAAQEMTTLHVRVDALDRVARQFPAIGSLRVEADFPHGLRIHVIERTAAALVTVDGAALPVAADGTVLAGLRPPPGLPVLRTDKPQTEGRLTDERTLRALVVLGAAPAGLTQRVDGVTEDSARGIVVELQDGPEILFGDATRARAKWAAATRVLADPDAAGATYVDVRLPDRPVAGGLPVETIEPVVPAGEPIAAPPPAPIQPGGTTALDPAAAPVEATPEPVPAAPQTVTPPAPAAPPTTTDPAAPGTVTSPQP
jgi:cell division protein FtsQ